MSASRPCKPHKALSAHGTTGSRIIDILSATAVPETTLTLLRGWFEDQWGSIDPFTGNHPGIAVPAPLVAVDQQGALLGGLAFSSFAKPNAATVAVWVNALLVAPNHRRQGIAAALVAQATTAAQNLAILELFVLTEYPGLYEKAGWIPMALEAQRQEVILMKTVPPRHSA